MFWFKGIKVCFVIYFVVGCMLGQCNVLFVEVSVLYDIVLEMDEINDDFGEMDVIFVIGVNDIVNLIVLEFGSLIVGMFVLYVWKSKQVIVMKRGLVSGYGEFDGIFLWLGLMIDDCQLMFLI